MVTLNLTEKQILDLLKQIPPARRRKLLAALEDNSSRKERSKKWRRLLKETQSLPQAKRLTEKDIANEIMAYRAGK
ncbi:MAG: hypothetical protein AB1649_04180 [Chloroflexota bacterium]